ncbi:MAG: hypothetical protein ACR2PL_24875 [Dehalococcoidia bacterium]
MAHGEARFIDLADVNTVPGLLAVVEAVLQTQQPTIIRADGEPLAVISPAKEQRKVPARKGGRTPADDPFWDLIGIGHSGAGDISAIKQQYLIAGLSESETRRSGLVQPRL